MSLDVSEATEAPNSTEPRTNLQFLPGGGAECDAEPLEKTAAGAPLPTTAVAELPPLSGRSARITGAPGAAAARAKRAAGNAPLVQRLAQVARAIERGPASVPEARARLGAVPTEPEVTA